MVDISAHGFTLSVSPEHGGCVDRLTWNGIQILHPTRLPAASATDRAGFPMVPFAGRISDAVFSFDGRNYALPANFPPEPNAIHGFGWQTSWHIAEQTTDTLVLRHHYEGTHWPSAYRAEQDFRLTPDGLELDISLTNRGDTIMPAGLGWHPYFTAKGAQIRHPVSHIWRPENSARMCQPAALDTSNDITDYRSVEALDLDHCFSSTGSETEIIWPGSGVKVTMTGSSIFGHFVLYTPRGEPYFCAEPISHVPDAVNLPQPPDETGFVTLAPGQELSGRIQLRPSLIGDHVT